MKGGPGDMGHHYERLSEHGEREGVAPLAQPVEGAT